MHNWSDFQRSLPLLRRIEQCYLLLKSSQARQAAVSFQAGGNEQSHASAVSLLRHELEALVQQLDFDLSYWHFPFYEGNFVQLAAAIESTGRPNPMEARPEDRLRFRQFVRSMSNHELTLLPDSFSSPSSKTKSMRLLRSLAQQRATLATLPSAN